MTDQMDLFNQDSADQRSPFDAIRQTREDGTEYWSARDLMQAMNYTQWRKFEGAIDRARSSAGSHGSHHFAGADKVIPGGRWGNQTVSDVELTRYGAYLVVMNGDPRKPEIAAAQSYFAVKTREAEVTNPSGIDISTPQGVVAMAEQLLNTAKAFEQSEARRLELEGPAAERDLYRSSEGLQLIGDVATRFQAYAADRYPLVKVTHQDVRAHAGRLGLIIRGDTIRNNQPTAEAVKRGWVRPAETLVETKSHGTQRKVTTRLTVKGESRLWDGLVAYVESHGTLLISKEKAA